MTCRCVCAGAVGLIFDYTTPKLVTVRSVKLGLINRLVQLFIIGYIIGFVIVWKKGYQATDTAQSSVVTKVKGIASTLNREDLPSRYRKVWDTADYIIPPQETNAFFVLTNAIISEAQVQGKCGEDADVGDYVRCNSTADCADKEGEAVRNGNGIYTGVCDKKTETCEIYAWCPVEIDKLPPPLKKEALLVESENFTVLIKNFIEFPKFKRKKRNIIEKVNNSSYLRNCIYDSDTDPYCPIFRLGDVVARTGNSFQKLALQGGVVNIVIRWDCDLDYSLDSCNPSYDFSRLDNQDAKLAPGWNFRFTREFQDLNGNQSRILYKSYGILFVFSVQGKAGKFDVVPLFLNIGSGLALLGLATILCDLVLLRCLKKRQVYKKTKYVNVVDEDYVKFKNKMEEEEEQERQSNRSSVLGEGSQRADSRTNSYSAA